MAFVLVDAPSQTHGPGATPAVEHLDTRSKSNDGPVRSRSRTRRVLGHVVLAAVTVFSIFPIYWLFMISFKTPDEIFAFPPVWYPKSLQLANYHVLFKDGAVVRDGQALINQLTGVTQMAAGAIYVLGAIREVAHADAVALRWSDQANQRYVMLATLGLPEELARADGGLMLLISASEKCSTNAMSAIESSTRSGSPSAPP